MSNPDLKLLFWCMHATIVIIRKYQNNIITLHMGSHVGGGGGGFRHHFGFRKTEGGGGGGGFDPLLIPSWSGGGQKWMGDYRKGEDLLFSVGAALSLHIVFFVVVDPDSCWVPHPDPDLLMRAGSGSWLLFESRILVLQWRITVYYFICQWFLSMKQWSRKVNIWKFRIKINNNCVCTGRVPDPTSLFLPTSFCM
jgi:hypothetical protein